MEKTKLIFTMMELNGKLTALYLQFIAVPTIYSITHYLHAPQDYCSCMAAADNSNKWTKSQANSGKHRRM